MDPKDQAISQLRAEIY
jgi:WD repeat-containing protein 61